MQFKHVYVIGAGGIGSHLMESLCRLLAYHKNGTHNITLIDGDIYEEKNRIRQLFDAKFVGHNKAEVLARKIEDALFPIRFIKEYVNKDKFIEILENSLGNRQDPFLVITAVDNNATRKAVIEALDTGQYSNFVYLSGSNGIANGQVVSYVKILGESPRGHLFDTHPDLRYPDDHIPGSPGCQVEAPSTPQLISANMGAAWAILITVQAMLENSTWYEELHFDSVGMQLAFQGDGLKFPNVEIAPQPSQEKIPC